jgi:ATP-dependent DNA ligase
LFRPQSRLWAIASVAFGAKLYQRVLPPRPRNPPAAFIPPCRPTIALRPPRGEGWVHELKHDGYRLQIHVADASVRLYTMNAADWSAAHRA